MTFHSFTTQTIQADLQRFQEKSFLARGMGQKYKCVFHTSDQWGRYVHI